MLLPLLWTIAFATPANARAGESASSEVVYSRRLRIPIHAAFDASPAPSTAIQSVPPSFPAAVADVFGITDPAKHVRRVETDRDRLGFTRDVYQQFHNNVPVFTGRLNVVYSPKGGLRAATGRYYPLPADFDTTPSLAIDTAHAIAITDAPFRAAVFDCELTIVDPGWYGDPPIGPRLAYRLTLIEPNGIERIGVFLDANSGQVLDRWSMTCTAISRAVHDGVGQSSLPGALLRNEGDSAANIEDVDEAYDYAGDAYDFFANAFGRDGYDGVGITAVATVRANDIGAIPCPNASFDFVRHQMIFCAGTTADDLVAHEWTHGLTRSTANLLYQNQSGQLNESFSDVFGELVDLYNGGAESPGAISGSPWAAHASGTGNDAPNNARTAQCSFMPTLTDGVRWVIGEDAPAMSGPFRDMWNPNCFSHPAGANDPFQLCSIPDNGGVHSGSGVANHAFAMLCDGKTFNGQTVNGIGTAKAAAVWYRALTTYLTVGSDFEDAYVAFNLAAADLIGQHPNDPRTGMPTVDAFTAAVAAEVNKALLAVEMNTIGACGATDAPLEAGEPLGCASFDTIFSEDFENGAAGWTVANSAPLTPYDWELVGALPFARPGMAMFVEDRNVGGCNAAQGEAATHELISPAIVTPADATTLTLDFLHFMETEPRFDGGIVELQQNGGPWAQIPAAAFRFNRYNSSLFTAAEQGSSSPLAGRVAFSGAGGTWGRSVVELAGLIDPGDEIRLRFRFSKDYCFGLTGWWVDDVRVTACRSSNDCNGNGITDEIDRATGPAPQTLLDQPINLLAISNFSDLDPHPTLGPHKIAEDIHLIRPTRITAIRVRGGYSDDVATADDFTVAFYENNGGLPGVLIAEYSSVASTRIATGNTFFLNQEYAYELTLPAPEALAAGDYLVAVFNNTAGSAGTWRWGRAWFGWTPGAVFFGQGCNWCRIGTANFAIEVLGETVGRGRGDINADGARDVADIGGFVAVLLGGSGESDTRCAADMNADDAVDGDDVAFFVDCLIAQQCED